MLRFHEVVDPRTILLVLLPKSPRVHSSVKERVRHARKKPLLRCKEKKIGFVHRRKSRPEFSVFWSNLGESWFSFAWERVINRQAMNDKSNVWAMHAYNFIFCHLSNICQVAKWSPRAVQQIRGLCPFIFASVETNIHHKHYTRDSSLKYDSDWWHVLSANNGIQDATCCGLNPCS